MFLGWYDPDKKKPARLKLAEAIERYGEKFGATPDACLTSPTDAAELAADGKAPDLAVRAVGYIPRWTYYVGVDDEPAPALAA